MTATTATTPAVSEKLPAWRKIGYGLGDIYGGGAFIIINFFYLVFLTDVVRISPALAGIVILVSKVYDAITDPLEGVLSDRTRTTLGRRRPYLLAGIPLIFLSFFGLFFPANFDQEVARFVFVLCTYLFFSTVVSIVMLNYNAVQSELTLDYDERTSLSSVRIFFSGVSSLICALVPMEIVKQFNDTRQGWIVMGLAFGIFFSLPFIATFFAVKERKEFQKPPEPFNWRATFLEPFKVRTFVVALLMFLLAFVAIDAVSSVMVYFMKYHMQRGDEANYVAGTLLVFQIISLPFYVTLSKRTSKRFGFQVGGLIWIITMLATLLVTPESPGLLIYVVAAAIGLGTGGIVVMIYAIFPDIPDVDELNTSERREGTYSSLIFLSRKLASAVGLFAVSTTIGLAGYVQPVEEVIDGVTRLVDQPQSASFVLVLRLIFALVPLVMVLLAIFSASRYPLNGEVHERLKRLLARRRSGEPESAEMAAEAAELKHALIG